MDGFDLLIFVARGNFLCRLYGFLRLNRHFFKSQHNRPRVSGPILEKGLVGASPIIYRFTATLSQHYLPEGEAAIAGRATLTLICVGLASSVSGVVIVSTRLWYSALLA